MHRILGTFLLGLTLITPAAVRADDEHHKEKRYYDKERKDWHEWNEREERAYRRYLEEKRLQHRDWVNLERERQEEYWRWRHAHPDTMLYPPERR